MTSHKENLKKSQSSRVNDLMSGDEIEKKINFIKKTSRRKNQINLG